MNRLVILCVMISVTVAALAAPADNKAVDGVQAAADVLNELQGAPAQGIPAEVLGSANCVAVVPTMLKGVFILAARYGRGVSSCLPSMGRSAPTFLTVAGVSVGF